MPTIAVAGDFVILNLLFVKGFCLWHPGVNCLAANYLLFYVYLNLSWLVLAITFGANRIGRNTRKKELVYTYVKIIVFFFFLFLIYFQLFPLSYYSRDEIKYLFPLFFALLLFWKFSMYYAFLFYRKMGYNYRNVLILGYTPTSYELKNYFIANNWNGYRFRGFIDGEVNKKKQIVGTWQDLKHCIETLEVDEIYLTWERIPRGLMQEITAAINHFPVRVRIVPDLGEFSFKSAELINYDMVPVLQIHPGPLSFWYNRLVKRVFDIVLSLVMIAGVLSWMIPLLYVITLTVPGSGLFFIQKRTGLDGRVFKCIKFRTMRLNSEAHSRRAGRNDSRVTPLGRWLRKTSLDELPQFFNVLAGRMSVVGPRPHMLRHTDMYRQVVKQFMLRHTVKPGITGLAQVNGFRGEITRLSEIKNRVSFDVNYVESWSFALDLKIILLTILAIFRGDKKAY